jgi:hypothetical protein
MKREYLAFDIETAKAVSFEGSDWRQYRPLGICCAATILEGEDTPKIWHGGTSQKRPKRQMIRRELLGLLEYLAQKTEDGFTILTWNGVGFDFDVLAEESGDSKRCRQLANKHVDMMFHVLCRLGHGIGLASAAKGMGIEGKHQGLNSAAAPVLWAKGRHNEVFQYVGQDVLTTLNLAKTCEARGCLTWLSRNGRASNLRIPDGWLTVKQARKLPEPASAWYFSQWNRNKFTAWMD